METQHSPATAWFEPQLWQTHPVLQTTLTVTLVGPAGKCSIDCVTISGDDPLALEAWTWQLVRLADAVDSSIGHLRNELDRAIGSLSPF